MVFLLAPYAPAFPTGLGAAGASLPLPAPAASALASRPGGPLRRHWRRRPLHPSPRCSLAGVVLLVLESALDSPGLVATAGALNPLDVLVIGGQEGLQLQLEGVRLHFGVCIYHRSLVIKC